ncbi:hypothetical protein Bbelb_142010 [Branchiostoma belcheri]|nr:hypothetical protein Bbelb_142010 [Branchiostoma belcheri]
MTSDRLQGLASSCSKLSWARRKHKAVKRSAHSSPKRGGFGDSSLVARLSNSRKQKFYGSVLTKTKVCRDVVCKWSFGAQIAGLSGDFWPGVVLTPRGQAGCGATRK